MENSFDTIRNWVEVKVDDVFNWVNLMTVSESARAPFHWMDFTDDKIHLKGGKWLFRGQANDEWEIKSSLERQISAKCADRQRSIDVERFAIKEFRRLTECVGEDHNLNPFDCVALMQHYGIPTRLIDFTYSAYVALFFAADAREEFKDKDFSVWAICLDDLGLSGGELKDGDMNVDGGCRYSFYETKHLCGFDDLFSAKSFGVPRSRMYCACPQLGNKRSNAQAGVFLFQSDLSRSFMDDLTYCIGKQAYLVDFDDLKQENPFENECSPYLSRVITFKFDKSLREKARFMLRSMNISPHTLFPDLEGVSKTIVQSIKELKLDCVGI